MRPPENMGMGISPHCYVGQANVEGSQWRRRDGDPAEKLALQAHQRTLLLPHTPTPRLWISTVTHMDPETLF